MLRNCMLDVSLLITVACHIGLTNGMDSSTSDGNGVAIIGAGIGGSAAAFFMSQQLPDVKIDIFEQQKIGGRTTAIHVDGRVVEMGASIVHNQNKYFRDLANHAHLKLVEPGKGDTEKLFSIYNGKEIVFKQSSWDVLTLFSMIWRYGLSYFQFRKLPAAMLQKFLQIYELQQRNLSFASPEELFLEVGLYNLTQRTMREEVKENLGKGAAASRFGEEFVAGINHVNYNQNNSLNALAGMVSMLPTVDSNLVAVRGGNFQLAEYLVRASGASLHMPVQVSNVKKQGSAYAVYSQDKRHGLYDVVILASPLEHSDIELEVPDLPYFPARKYQRTVTTIISGRLNRSYFGSSLSPAGDYILVAEGSQTPFSVISPLVDYSNGTLLYKVFSAQPLEQDLMAALFPGARVIAEHDWLAYPRFQPPESFSRFHLAEGLFYNNAIETGASAMEISLIAAKNSALLAAKYLSEVQQCSRDIDATH